LFESWVHRSRILSFRLKPQGLMLPTVLRHVLPGYRVCYKYVSKTQVVSKGGSRRGNVIQGPTYVIWSCSHRIGGGVLRIPHVR
jgi:hypothetical protein